MPGTEANREKKDNQAYGTSGYGSSNTGTGYTGTGTGTGTGTTGYGSSNTGTGYNSSGTGTGYNSSNTSGTQGMTTGMLLKFVHLSSLHIANKDASLISRHNTWKIGWIAKDVAFSHRILLLSLSGQSCCIPVNTCPHIRHIAHQLGIQTGIVSALGKFLKLKSPYVLFCQSQCEVSGQLTCTLSI